MHKKENIQTKWHKLQKCVQTHWWVQQHHSMTELTKTKVSRLDQRLLVCVCVILLS